MIHRSYYPPHPEQPYYHFNQEMNQVPQQPLHDHPPINRPPVQQTPYEYFAKPQQPNWQNFSQQQTQIQGNHPPRPPIKPAGGIMSNFQKEDGKVDIDKMLGTVGQMANTYHQVSPIFKQFGTFLKGFR
ncbi:YppG family protein [Virgibacillus kimchii]